MESKAFYQSKTFWFAVLYAVFNIAGIFGFETYQPDPETVSIVGIIVSALVIIFRFVSKQPIR